MLKELYREATIALRMAQRIIDREVLVRRDIAARLKALGDDPDLGILHHEVLRDWTGGAVAILVLFRPDGEAPGDLVRLARALDAKGVRVILVANHRLSEDQRRAFEGVAGELVERQNQGLDLGAYRALSLELGQRGTTPSRVLYLNDSVFYAARGLDSFVDALLGEAAVIAAFENWAEGHHLQSFALSVSGEVFVNPAVRDFWRDYRGIDNRVHAIEAGEKGLSAALHAATRDIEVIFPVSALARALRQSDARGVRIDKLPIGWRREADRVLGHAEATGLAMALETARVVGDTSPIHAGAWAFPRFLGCPLFKKDLVIRERFTFAEVEDWSSEVMDEADRREFLAILRQRGEPGRLGRRERRRIAVGL